MNFRFDFLKAMQAAGVLLEYERTRRMSYMRLLKLLYIADRESLLESGRPITGDHAAAMKRGPVLSRVYDLIRGRSPKAGEWDQFVHTDCYAVDLVRDPGRGQLSRFEVDKLLEVSDRYRNLDDWDLSEETHKLEEWKKHYAGNNSSCPIPWEEVLTLGGKPEMIEEAEKDERAREAFDAIFGGWPALTLPTLSASSCPG